MNIRGRLGRVEREFGKQSLGPPRKITYRIVYQDYPENKDYLEVSVEYPSGRWTSGAFHYGENKANEN